MSKKPNPEMIDAENPEWTGEMFTAAKPFSAMPEQLKASLRGQRGMQKAPTKERITIRVSSEVTEYFRSTGKGWQTRLDDVLKEYVSAHS